MYGNMVLDCPILRKTVRKSGHLSDNEHFSSMNNR